MIKVRERNTNYLYILPDHIDELLQGADGCNLDPIEPFVVHLATRTGSVRVALFPKPLQQDRTVTNFLVWPSGVDVKEIDQRLTDGLSVEALLVDSIKTCYSLLACPNCGTGYHCLIVEPGSPYLGSPGLLEDKIARHKYLSCPKCLASFRQLVTTILSNVA